MDAMNEGEMKIRFDNNGFSFTVEADKTKEQILRYAAKIIRQYKPNFKLKKINEFEYKII